MSEKEVPSSCDFCDRHLNESGSRYRHLTFTIDGEDSVRGESECGLENSYDLLSCTRCYERIVRLVFANLSGQRLKPLVEQILVESAPADFAAPVGFSTPTNPGSEDDLLDQFEKEQTVLDPAETIRAALERNDGCCQCHQRQQVLGASIVRVNWKCEGCERPICRFCALTIPGSQPLQYFETTLCSIACWEKMGRPLQ